jgi:hypothetical protein
MPPRTVVSFFLFALILGSSSAVAAEEVPRTLTSREGTSIKAWIRKVENGQITIRKEDGRVMTFPLDRLCEEDRASLGKMEAKAGVPPPLPALGTRSAQASVQRRVYPRTIDEMRSGAASIRATSLLQPGFTEEERAALAELNLNRFFCGVPAVVELTRRFCDGANKASEGCAKIGTLSHEATPEGMRCNLCRNEPTFTDSVGGFIEDSGDNNRERRGHRGWCLHPDLAQTGFGSDPTKEFMAMWVSDGSTAAGANSGREKQRRRDFHAWPGEGFFPAARMKGNGWSIYPPDPIDPEKVHLRVFELKQRLDRPLASSVTPEGATEIKIPFQHVETEKSPWRHGTIVFEPELDPEPGKIFWVSLKSGSVRLSYCVEFIEDDF